MTRYARSDIDRLFDRVHAVKMLHLISEEPEGIAALPDAERTLFEEITPEFIYMLVDGETARPVAWATNAAELREWLETDRDGRVWKLARTDPSDSVNCTDDFARTWINDHGDFSEEFDDFLHKLGPWLSMHYDDLARDMYLTAQVRDA